MFLAIKSQSILSVTVKTKFSGNIRKGHKVEI